MFVRQVLSCWGVSFAGTWLPSPQTHVSEDCYAQQPCQGRKLRVLGLGEFGKQAFSICLLWSQQEQGARVIHPEQPKEQEVHSW